MPRRSKTVSIEASVLARVYDMLVLGVAGTKYSQTGQGEATVQEADTPQRTGGMERSKIYGKRHASNLFSE